MKFSVYIQAERQPLREVNKMATAVAKKSKKEVQISTIDPQMLIDDIGAGSERMDAEDLQIPRIKLLQSINDECNKQEAKYVPGAEAGMIYNTVTKKLYDGETGIRVVVIKYRRALLEWKPKLQGLEKDHDNDSSCLVDCTRGDKGEYFTADGNEIIITGEYFVYVLEEDGSYHPAIMSLSKTNFTKAKLWNSLINGLQIPHPTKQGETFNPATFYTAYDIVTLPQKGEVGTYFVFDASFAYEAGNNSIMANHPRGNDIYIDARNFLKTIESGAFSVQEEEQVSEEVM